jgi:hypothetical protein
MTYFRKKIFGTFTTGRRNFQGRFLKGSGGEKSFSILLWDFLLIKIKKLELATKNYFKISFPYCVHNDLLQHSLDCTTFRCFSAFSEENTQ